MAETTYNNALPLDILDDLSSRFVINSPEEERLSPVRVLFQIENAHWFYIDFYTVNGQYKKLGLKEFSYNLFKHIPHLRVHLKEFDKVFDEWKSYKQAVPTYGAIILNEDMTHCLLVQGYYARSSWGFPKGKVNEEESPMNCAIREVLEETGYDISPQVNENDFLEATINEQKIRLYVVTDVPMGTKFSPNTRCEIRACQWFPLADLPANRNDVTTRIKMGIAPNSFFMVTPFIQKLKKWIYEKNNIVLLESTNITTTYYRRSRLKSLGDINDVRNGKKAKGGQNGKDIENTADNNSMRNPISPAQIKNGRGRAKRIQLNSQSNGEEKAGDRRYSENADRKHSDNADNNNMKNGKVTTNGFHVKNNEKPKNKVKFDKDGFPISHAPSWTNFKFDRNAIMKQLL